jgi:hypothetical protein
MVRKAVIASLWVASLVGAVAASSAMGAQPQRQVPKFSATRIASDNGFTLVQTYASPQAAECFMLHEGTNGVAMAPAKCP